jgi:hypothetical protein
MKIEGVVHVIHWHALQETKCLNISHFYKVFENFIPDAFNSWKSPSGVCV